MAVMRIETSYIPGRDHRRGELTQLAVVRPGGRAFVERWVAE